MRIVDRRFLAALLALWLVLAVGLAAQAAPPAAETIVARCQPSPCHVGDTVFVSGDGLTLKKDADVYRFWVQVQWESYPYQARVTPEGHYYLPSGFTADASGVTEVCLTFHKDNGQIITLVCTTVEILPVD